MYTRSNHPPTNIPTTPEPTQTRHRARNPIQVISGQQLRKGFTRLYQLLPDLSLDVPNARPLLDAMVKQVGG